jgi:hypothetical protein
MEGLFYISIPKAYRRLLPLRRLFLYIYTKGLAETSPTQKAYSIYIPKAYRRLLPLRRLILYIYTKGLAETPPTEKAYSIYLYQRLTGESTH